MPRRRCQAVAYRTGWVLGLLVLLAPLSAHARNANPDEEINIRVYKQAGSGVVNVTATAIDIDFFLRPIPQQGVGSGSVIDKRGHILTNFHVIENAQRLEVTLADGSRWPAQVVGVDPGNDLALVRIEAPPQRLTVIPLGDSSTLQVGQKVLAIGNPFGLERTLTVGIVSSLGRMLRAPNGRVIKGVIQTDAAINQGNSGGPLLNSAGEMVGINSAIFTPSGGSVGIGFAVPVNTAKAILQELMTRGRVVRPWLGITGQDVHSEVARLLKLPASEGVLVAQVFRGSAAERAGIRGATSAARVGNLVVALGGDLIVALDGRPVRGLEELTEAIEAKRPGATATLALYRGTTRREVSVTLGERPLEVDSP